MQMMESSSKRKKVVGDQKQERLNSVDILMEILSRLPCSSLSRFIFVSKLWCTIIRDPFLADLHSDRGLKLPCRPSIMVFSKDKCNSHLSLIDESGQHLQHVLTLSNKHHVSPPCEGLICIYNNTGVTIFNPTTHEKLLLAPPPRSGKPEHYSQCFLGFLPSTKEYKLFRVYSTFSPRESRVMFKCEVLTVGTCAWRQINPNIGWHNVYSFKSLFFRGRLNGSASCGTIYLLQKTYGGYFESNLVSFNLEHEKLSAIRFPRKLSHGEVASLLELRGHVCVSISMVHTIEMWTLESIVTPASSTNTNRIDAHWIRRYTLRMQYTFSSPVPMIVHRGKVLMRSPRTLYYQDLKDASRIRRKEIRRKMIYKQNCMRDAYLHVGSLVSLGSLNKVLEA